jgi:hypothetical protein
VSCKYSHSQGLALEGRKACETARGHLQKPLRDLEVPNWLSNWVFQSYDDIAAHYCCDAWNELMDQPWRIRSIGRRDWADAS